MAAWIGRVILVFITSIYDFHENISHRIHGAGIYMLTLGVQYIDGIHVTIYSSTMDPMGMKTINTRNIRIHQDLSGPACRIQASITFLRVLIVSGRGWRSGGKVIKDAWIWAQQATQLGFPWLNVAWSCHE